MSEVTETITIVRKNAPYQTVIELHVPDDGHELVDLKSVVMDGKRMEPVETKLANPILSGLAKLYESMAPVAEELYQR